VRLADVLSLRRSQFRTDRHLSIDASLLVLLDHLQRLAVLFLEMLEQLLLLIYLWSVVELRLVVGSALIEATLLDVNVLLIGSLRSTESWVSSRDVCLFLQLSDVGMGEVWLGAPGGVAGALADGTVACGACPS